MFGDEGVMGWWGGTYMLHPPTNRQHYGILHEASEACKVSVSVCTREFEALVVVLQENVKRRKNLRCLWCVE